VTAFPLLRPWRDEDAPALIAAAGDAELQRWTTVRVPDTPAALQWLSVQHTGWSNGTRYSFAVLDEREQLLGNVALKRPGAFGETEVGYWTAEHARGRGVASQAVEALSRWAFETFPEVQRLALLHQVGNLASCRVALKSGFPYERTLPAQGPYPQDGHLHARPR
jgi:RimJ/RimL family protein N-acetyltransferase